VTTPDVDGDSDLLGAVADLGDALRSALEASVSTVAPAAALRAAARTIRDATAPLRSTPRSRSALPATDDMAGGVRVFNPVVGIGSGVAVPLTFTRGGDGVVAQAVLGQVYEGPPTFLHGGIAALLMDQVLGQAAIESDRWGMTVNLELRYRRPVPLHTSLRLTGRVSNVDGRRTTATGTIALESAPDVALIEATGAFVCPSPAASAAYFSMVRTAAGGVADGRLGRR
jgi:acyl-coenzyme A thioesterase PaaI-like protein